MVPLDPQATSFALWGVGHLGWDHDEAMRRMGRSFPQINRFDASELILLAILARQAGQRMETAPEQTRISALSGPDFPTGTEGTVKISVLVRGHDASGVAKYAIVQEAAGVDETVGEVRARVNARAEMMLSGNEAFFGGLISLRLTMEWLATV